MPKPPLPPHLVKNVELRVVFRSSEIEHLKKMAALTRCRTLSEYVRKALLYYETYSRKNEIEDIC
jgi:gamma-glutamyl:cysteine ligase YbdK (ATP-grasp superfamily)